MSRQRECAWCKKIVRIALKSKKKKGSGRYTLHQLIPLRSLLQVLFQTVRRALAVQLLLGGLERSA
jgi:hypothetical protein